MSTNKPALPSLVSLLDRVVLTDVERIRAEAAMLRGEYLAELMLRGFSAVGRAVRSIRQLSLRTKTPRDLGPTA